jgi:hypothetical protein
VIVPAEGSATALALAYNRWMHKHARTFQMAALALLTGCSSATVSGGIPQGAGAAGSPLHGIAAPASAPYSLYVALASAGRVGVYGYAGGNRKNHPPSCSLESGGYASDVTADDNEDLLAVNSEEAYVYQGPSMCGKLLATLNTEGFSEDIASNDAVKGKIIVANIYSDGTDVFGGVEICALSNGCTNEIRNSDILSVFGVALDKHGDCWASGKGAASQAVLVYFKGCSGSGQLANGYGVGYPGGVDIDKHGNLVVVDGDAVGDGGGFLVYKGCKPNCKLIGGPFAAEGASEFGHLNEDSTAYVAGDYQYGQVDVYKYSPTKMTYEYSFNNSLSAGDVGGATFVPRAKQ